MTNFFFDFKSCFILLFLFLVIFVFGNKIIATFAVLLGVLCFFARLRLNPMNLICIITAQGNGSDFFIDLISLTYL